MHDVIAHVDEAIELLQDEIVEDAMQMCPEERTQARVDALGLMQRAARMLRESEK
jgi:hypothetical protein